MHHQHLWDSLQLLSAMGHVSVGATLHYMETPWKFFLSGVITSGVVLMVFLYS